MHDSPHSWSVQTTLLIKSYVITWEFAGSIATVQVQLKKHTARHLHVDIELIKSDAFQITAYQIINAHKESLADHINLSVMYENDFDYFLKPRENDCFLSYSLLLTLNFVLSLVGFMIYWRGLSGLTLVLLQNSCELFTLITHYRKATLWSSTCLRLPGHCTLGHW